MTSESQESERVMGALGGGDLLGAFSKSSDAHVDR